MCSQTDVGVDIYPEIVDRGYRQHISRLLPICTGEVGSRCCRRPEAHQSTSVFDGFTCSRLAHIQDDTSLKQADILISEGVDVTRLTEAVDLSVVCVGVRGSR